jgi:hypothetical protein
MNGQSICSLRMVCNGGGCDNINGSSFNGQTLLTQILSSPQFGTTFASRSNRTQLRLCQNCSCARNSPQPSARGRGKGGYSRNFLSFGMHIRFAKRKWVDVVLYIQVRQAMIDKTVSCFVRTNGVNDIEKFCVRT